MVSLRDLMNIAHFSATKVVRKLIEHVWICFSHMKYIEKGRNISKDNLRGNPLPCGSHRLCYTCPETNVVQRVHVQICWNHIGFIGKVRNVPEEDLKGNLCLRDLINCVFLSQIPLELPQPVWFLFKITSTFPGNNGTILQYNLEHHLLCYLQQLQITKVLDLNNSVAKYNFR